MDTTTLLWALPLGGFFLGFFLEYLVDLFWFRRRMRESDIRSLQAESMLREQVEEVEYLRFQVAKFNESFDEYDRYTKKLEYDLEGKQLELAEARVQHEAADARARQFQADVVSLRRQIQQGGSTDDSKLASELARYKRALYDSVNENKLLTAQMRDYETRLLQKQQLDNALLSANGEGEVYKSLEPAPTIGESDPLEKINGIGSVYADRLRAAGIRTFADLSRMRAERLTDIIQPRKWQSIEPERWIAEATDFVNLNGSVNGDSR